MLESSARRSAALVLLVVVLAWLDMRSSALAQAAIASASDEQQQAARTAYAEGVQAFEQRDYARALERFDAADGAVSSPNVKLMRARCLAQLGRETEAHAMYGATIREAATSGEERYETSAATAAEERIALEAKLVMVTLKVKDETERAKLALNGQELPRERWGEPVPVAPGALVITLTAADGREDRIEHTLPAGARAQLALSLAAPAPAPRIATTAPVPVTRPHTAAQASAPSDRGTAILPIALAAAGGAGLVAFGVLGAMSNAQHEKLKRECPSQQGCDPALADTASSGETYQTIANVSLAAGVLLLAAGTTLFVLDLPSGVQVAVTSHGAQLRGAL